MTKKDILLIGAKKIITPSDSLIREIFESIESFPENFTAREGLILIVNQIPWIGGLLHNILFGNKDKNEVERILSLLRILVFG